MLRRSICLAVLLTIFSVGIACAQFTGAKMQLTGVNCALCAKTTERALRALPYVSDVKPDLSHNIYVLSFKPGQAVDFDQISKVVHDENFFITFFKTTVDMGQVKLDNNAFKAGSATYHLVNSGDKALDGQLEFTLVDKGFAPRSVSKKYPGALEDNSSKSA